MTSLALLFAFSAAASAAALPQDPVAPPRPSAAVFDTLRDLDQLELATRLERGIRAHRRGEIGLRAPGLARALRDTGRDVIDAALLGTALDDKASGPLEIFEVAHRAWGFDGAWRRVPRGLDLDGFEDLLEEAYRDIQSAIGSGRLAEDVASRLVGEIEELVRNRWTELVEGPFVREPIREDGREAFARAAQVDQRELLQIARWITAATLELTRPESLQRLRARSLGDPTAVLDAVEGEVLHDGEAAFGRIVVGGPGPNKYNCNYIDVIIDLGGDDVYEGRAGGAGEHNQLSVVIDMAGNDSYTCLNGGLGSGTLGLGMLLDLGGDDRYEARDRSGGYGAGGVGVLLDAGGEDEYVFGDSSGGVGFGGTGLFVDLAGDDKQRAGPLSFGCGLPAGLGLFYDRAGDDERGLSARPVEAKPSVRDDGQTPTQVSFGGGVGLGMLPWIDGGLGIYIDGAGRDRFMAVGAIAAGAGAHGGVGVFREMRGDDRVECNGMACGVAFDRGVGVFLDEAGDDGQRVGKWGFGVAWRAALAAAFDGDGDDTRVVTGESFGVGRVDSIAWFVDLAGRDRLTRKTLAGPFAFAPAGPPPAGVSEREGLGLYLHLGGAEDHYEAVEGEPEMRDGMAVVPVLGPRTDRAVRILVDR
jgi:hypothetical protein